jgi:hypothetical protein
MKGLFPGLTDWDSSVYFHGVQKGLEIAGRWYFIYGARDVE